MSSFIRKKGGAGTTGDTVGTRPGPHGIPVVSSGHADLDKLYGGGIPLGTLNLVSEDGWTSHHRYILQYFVSEGLAVGQRVAMVTFGSSTIEEYILKNMTRQDAAKEEAAEKAAEAAAREETKLRIAWQYEKFAKKSGNTMQSASTSTPALGTHKSPMMRTRSPWCHDFDISKPPSKEELEKTLQQQGGACTYSLAAGDPFVAKTLSYMKEFSQSIKTSSTVGRVVIPSLGGVEWTDASDARLLGLLMLLKQHAQQTQLCIFISVPLQEMSPSLAAKMCHVVDSVLDLQSVEDMSQVVKLSPDPRTVAGHVEIRKLPAFGAPSAPLPQITSYVIRHKRRRITIRPVEVDPDAEFQQQEQGQGSGTDMAMACGGGHPRTRHTLDF